MKKVSRKQERSFEDEIIVKGKYSTDFRVKFVKKGDKYGRNNVLVAEDNLVEFYDIDTEQFVSRYLMETLLERKPNVGLSLQGDQPEWTVSSRGMADVYDWLKKVQFFIKENNNKIITIPEDVTIDLGDREVILEKGDRVKVLNEIGLGYDPPHDSTDPTTLYKFMSRFQRDVEYWLNAGGRNDRHLFYDTAEEQAEEMIKLYNRLPEEPEWLTPKELAYYVKELTR